MRINGKPDGPSLLSLVVANLVPLVGLLFWDWDLRSILLLYWAENAVIGSYNVLKMLIIGRWLALPVILFFLMHYGLFMAVHLFFVLMLTGGSPFSIELGGASLFAGARDAITTEVAAASGLLFVSHGVSFYRNFLTCPQARRVPLRAQLFAPYLRVVVLHLTVLSGAFLCFVLQAPTMLLLVLIALKIIVDLLAHMKSNALLSLTLPN